MIDTFLKRFPGAPTILIVEDEGVLREMERGILEHFGFNVLEADSGRRAYDLWRNEGEKVDLLLADIILPRGITGAEIIELLKELLETKCSFQRLEKGIELEQTCAIPERAAEQRELRVDARFSATSCSISSRMVFVAFSQARNLSSYALRAAVSRAGMSSRVRKPLKNAWRR